MTTAYQDIHAVCKKILRREGRPNPDAIGRIKLHQEDFQSNSQQKEIRVDLYNFGIDGNVPRPEHKAWLKKQLLPFVRYYRYHVKIHGRASGSGSGSANARVSRERLFLVKEYLTQIGLSEAQVPGNELQVQSNHFATNPGVESQFDRAVRLVLSPGWKTLPNPPPPQPPTWIPEPLPELDLPSLKGLPPKDYRIRYVGGGGAALVLGKSYHVFEIMDSDGNKKRFQLDAVHVDVGFHVNLGPKDEAWADFTSPAQDLSQFDGRRIVMTTVGFESGTLSRTDVHIPGSKSIQVDTGVGLNVGLNPGPWSGGVGSLAPYDPNALNSKEQADLERIKRQRPRDYTRPTGTPAF